METPDEKALTTPAAAGKFHFPMVRIGVILVFDVASPNILRDRGNSRRAHQNQIHTARVSQQRLHIVTVRSNNRPRAAADSRRWCTR